MLAKVKVSPKRLKDYKRIVSNKVLEKIESLAKELKGIKVVMINSTPKGGGVAEILKSLVPLMRNVGIRAEWYVIPPKKEFFEVTKQIYNALQGKEYEFSLRDQKIYLDHLKTCASLMREMRADIWVIHDPQPAGVILYLPKFHPSILRIHIDLTSPNFEVWNFFAGIFGKYDKIILTSKEFVQKKIKEKVVTFPPAIDPLTKKNKALPVRKAKKILEEFGIDTKRPLISQISRFDPWKDPLGAIEVFKLAKKKIPTLQLALVGFLLAKDDPEALEVLKRTKKAAEKDIFLFWDPKILGNLDVDTFVNAFQTASEVILQKSIREGFNLSVTEAMWKEKAVVAGKVGGIKIQIENGKNGFLISTSEEAAKRICQLIENPKLARKLGKKAKETAREKFLIPRLLRDYLELFLQVFY